MGLKVSLFHCFVFIGILLSFASLGHSSTIDIGKEVFDESGNEVELPVLFISHGAPVLIMNDEPVFGGEKNDVGYGSAANDWYRQLPKQLNLEKGVRRPKAIVMISAHYENRNSVLITAKDKYPELYYDYSGFPKYTYEVKYPCAGNSALAEYIKSLLVQGGIPAQLDLKRNIDHGGFIPLMLMYPSADIPVLQLSLFSNMDPVIHLKMGQLLAPLRKQGVLIIGSGQATHGYFDEDALRKNSQIFLDGLTPDIMSVASASIPLDKTRRYQRIINWKEIPKWRSAHPRPEHFMPIAAVIGASRPEERGEVLGNHWLLGVHSLRSFGFGDMGTTIGKNSTLSLSSSSHAISHDEL